MAYIPPKEQDDQQEQGMNVLGQQPPLAQPEQQPPAQQQEGIQVASATPQLAPTPETSVAAPAPRKTQQPKGSGLFTNIRKYVEANKPQAQAIAQTVTQRTGAGTQEAGQSIAQKQQQLADQLQQNAQKARSFVQQSVEQAGREEFDPQDLQQYEQIRTGQYEIGKNIAPQSFAQEQLKAEELQRMANLAGSGRGREELLRRTFQDQNQYSRGQQKLDALILQGDPDAGRQMTEQVGQTAQQFGDLVTQAKRQSLQNLASKVAGESDLAEFAKGEAIGAKDQLREQLTSLEAQRETEAQALRDRLETSYLDRDLELGLDDVRALGLSEGQKLYGVDPRSLLKARDFNLEQVATKDDLARAEALAGLAGMDTQNIFKDTEAVGGEYGLLEGGQELQEAIEQRKQEYERLQSLDKRFNVRDAIARAIAKEEAGTAPSTGGVSMNPIGSSGGAYNSYVNSIDDRAKEYSQLSPEEFAKKTQDFLKSSGGNDPLGSYVVNKLAHTLLDESYGGKASAMWQAEHGVGIDEIQKRNMAYRDEIRKIVDQYATGKNWSDYGGQVRYKRD